MSLGAAVQPAVPDATVPAGSAAPASPAVTTAPDAAAIQDAARLAAVALANGNLTAAEAHAFTLFKQAYGGSAAPGVAEAYAHQLAFMQNPVLNPGFELEVANGVTAWTGNGLTTQADPDTASAFLVVPDGGVAAQTFGDATARTGGPLGMSAALIGDSGLTAGLVNAPDSVSLSFKGSGLARLLVADAATGRLWEPRDEPLAGVGDNWSRVRVPLLNFTTLNETDPEDPRVEFTDGSSAPVAIATSGALAIALEFEGTSGLRVDDVVIDGAALGPSSRLAFELDNLTGGGGDASQFLQTVGLPPFIGNELDNAGAPAPSLDDLEGGDAGPVARTPDHIDLTAHDGHAVIIVPLNATPSLFADGFDSAPAGVAEAASAFATRADWTFFVTTVRYTPSGPRFVAPLSGNLSLGDTVAAEPVETAALLDPVRVAFGADDVKNLTDQGRVGALFANLYAAQGFKGVITGAVVAVPDVNVTDATLVRATVAVPEPYYDFAPAAYGGDAAAFEVDGYFHYLKTATPGRAIGDALDATPQSLYPGRQGTALAAYAAARSLDTSDGFIPLITPTRYDPVAAADPPDHVAISVNSTGSYNLQLRFVDYRPGSDGATVVHNNSTAVLALFKDAAEARATMQSGDNAWLADADLLVCANVTLTPGCDVAFNVTPSGVIDIGIPAERFLAATRDNGGEFFAVAWMDVETADDAEFKTNSSRGMFSPVTNALVAAVEGQSLDTPAGTVQPFWAYAAADAASYALAPIEFLPITALTDRHAVIIEFIGETTQLALGGGANYLTQVLPDDSGNYSFRVRFREYADNGRALRDRVVGADAANLSRVDFRLLRAPPALTSPYGAMGDFLWQAKPEHITVDGDHFVIQMPAYELVDPTVDAGALLGNPTSGSGVADAPKPPRVQELTAWAALEVSDLPDVRDPPPFDTSGLSGYYNAAKNALATDAVADHLDYTVGVFALDRAVEEYEIDWTSLTSLVNTSRDVAGQVSFILANVGSFRETFEVSLDYDTDFVAASFVPGAVDTDHISSDGQTLMATLAAGASETVRVALTPTDAVPNGAPLDVTITATLDHPVAPGADPVSRAITGQVQVGPLVFSVDARPAFNASPLPGVEYPVIFDVSIPANGVTETFDVEGAQDPLFTKIESSVSATGLIAVGGSEAVTVTHQLVASTPHGVSRTVTFNATPQHGGTMGQDAVTLVVPTSRIAIDPVPAFGYQRANQQITLDYAVSYNGPYVEAFDFAVNSSTLGLAPGDFSVVVEDAGVPTAVSRWTFQDPDITDSLLADTVIVRVTFTIPSNVAFGSRHYVTLTANSTNPASTQHDIRASAPFDVQDGEILVTAPTGVLYGLQGDTITRTFEIDAEMHYDASFAFQPVTTGELFVGTPQVDIQTRTFDVPSHLEGLDPITQFTLDVVVTATFRDDVDYGARGTLGLNLTRTGGTVWNAVVPLNVSADIGVFSLVPTLQFTNPATRTFPEDVAAVHPVTLNLALLPWDEELQWGTRSVNFNFSATHTNADEGAASWTDTLPAPVTIRPGATASVSLATVGNTTYADDTLELTATATGVEAPKLLTSEATATTVIYTADDFVVHSMFVGCYGTSGTDCVRVAGPVQALSAHDLPGTYARAVMLTGLVRITGEDAPRYYDLQATDAVAAVETTAFPLDPTLRGTQLALALPSGEADDVAFTVFPVSGAFLAAPGRNVDVPEATAAPEALPEPVLQTGVANIVWEASQTGNINRDWFLQRLGPLDFQTTLTVHGLTSNPVMYDPVHAMLPLLAAATPGEAATSLTDAGRAYVTTDKDDPDGDGHWTANELRSGSNPLLTTSTPYSDDDADGHLNYVDLVPFYDLNCVTADAQTLAEAAACQTDPVFRTVAYAPTLKAPSTPGPDDVDTDVLLGLVGEPPELPEDPTEASATAPPPPGVWDGFVAAARAFYAAVL